MVPLYGATHHTRRQANQCPSPTASSTTLWWSFSGISDNGKSCSQLANLPGMIRSAQRSRLHTRDTKPTFLCHMPTRATPVQNNPTPPGLYASDPANPALSPQPQTTRAQSLPSQTSTEPTSQYEQLKRETHIAATKQPSTHQYKGSSITSVPRTPATPHYPHHHHRRQPSPHHQHKHHHHPT